MRLGLSVSAKVSIEVHFVLGVFSFHSCSPADAHLRVGTEGMLDNLGHEEPRINGVSLAGGIELIRALLLIVLFGILAKTLPVLLEHDRIVNSAIVPGNFHESGHDPL